MLQPLRLALPLALMLAWEAAAQAQATPGGRVKRERTVRVAHAPADPLPVVHVAQDTMTLLFFPAPIQKKSLTFNESRLRVLDAGERSVIVQPVEDLGAGERQELGVFFADGRSPSRAAFVLVTAPGEVDLRIDVQRPEPLSPDCRSTAQAPAPKPEDFVLLGYVDGNGVTASSIKGKVEAVKGLGWTSMRSFRGAGWILADVEIFNGPAHPAWTPREATFAGRVGVPLRARLILKKPGPILPRENGRVLAVVEVPETKADLVFTLEVRGDGGRRLTIPDVRFPQPTPRETR
ncbi:DUF2381 family protein [Myxococcus sp. SDU36]|uniref:DUF2381 family protein n=1 Tax=Myxococcus sp. SDU36 TaxID=2831967 RepID=UPI002543399E|nr:DUF2381 family protein [Myxococcus sp. SDU36]WIG93641.1 DUF2381 family protein [Myxococcus sp. SDU36]